MTEKPEGKWALSRLMEAYFLGAEDNPDALEDVLEDGDDGDEQRKGTEITDDDGCRSTSEL